MPWGTSSQLYGIVLCLGYWWSIKRSEYWSFFKNIFQIKSYFLRKKLCKLYIDIINTIGIGKRLKRFKESIQGRSFCGSMKISDKSVGFVYNLPNFYYDKRCIHVIMWHIIIHQCYQWKITQNVGKLNVYFLFINCELKAYKSVENV